MSVQYAYHVAREAVAAAAAAKEGAALNHIMNDRALCAACVRPFTPLNTTFSQTWPYKNCITYEENLQ